MEDTYTHHSSYDTRCEVYFFNKKRRGGGGLGQKINKNRLRETKKTPPTTNSLDDKIGTALGKKYIYLFLFRRLK